MRKVCTSLYINPNWLQTQWISFFMETATCTQCVSITNIFIHCMWVRGNFFLDKWAHMFTAQHNSRAHGIIIYKIVFRGKTLFILGPIKKSQIVSAYIHKKILSKKRWQWKECMYGLEPTRPRFRDRKHFSSPFFEICQLPDESSKQFNTSRSKTFNGCGWQTYCMWSIASV